MINRSWIDPRVAQVTVDAIRSYMLNHGLTLQPFPGPELLVFGGQVDDDGQPIELVLPLIRAHARLSHARGRPHRLVGRAYRYVGDVLNDILQAGAASPPSPNGAASSATPSPTAGR